MGRYWFLFVFMNCIASIYLLVRPYESSCVFSGLYTSLCVLMGPYASLWIVMCPYWSLCVLMGP